MILIRADANKIIGTGHVMRCLSIATAFQNAGREVIFVIADHEGDTLIHANGFQSVCLNSNWTLMEKENICAVVESLQPELVLIDSYYVTKQYFSMLSGLSRIAYIDDWNMPAYKVDYLINYNIYASAQDYSGNQKAGLLLGPQYAPLRKEFQSLSAHVHKDNVTDILILAGGADPESVTEKLMTQICSRWQNLCFHFVVGALNPRLDNIQKQAGQLNNISLHINEKHMADLMRYCDLAISAAGSTLYELCACGIPTISYSMADNQLKATKEFSKRGVMITAGDCREYTDFILHLELQLGKLIENKTKRRQMSESMQKLVDGMGAERLMNALLK